MSVLYTVGTPLGNIKDITIRALEIFGQVDAVFCEDTRKTRKLLVSYDIDKPLVSCRSHNERKAAQKAVTTLKSGKSIAFATDAGTPGVSDPGATLIRVVRDAGFTVIPIPGPSAVSSIISVHGYSEKAVTFEGFLSPKKGRRRKRLSELLDREEGFILYESPVRLLKLLEDLSEMAPKRTVLMVREMTKVFEEIIEQTSLELLQELNKRDTIRGEITLLVSGNKFA